MICIRGCAELMRPARRKNTTKREEDSGGGGGGGGVTDQPDLLCCWWWWWCGRPTSLLGGGARPLHRREGRAPRGAVVPRDGVAGATRLSDWSTLC